MKTINSITGKTINQGSYLAFLPAELPIKELLFNNSIINLLADAMYNIGLLKGLSGKIPNPDNFIASYVTQEALLSTQIEGTQASLDDVYKYENEDDLEYKEVKEVVNYINALNYGLVRLNEFPMSLRLIREIHEKLLSGNRGETKAPGEFRRTQNWIGKAGCTLETAEYVPPPAVDMLNCLNNFEKYLWEADDLHALIKCAFIHAHFESIHPFLDGNGRVGRLLVTFYLCWKGILEKPLLYLSYFFKKYRSEYYHQLNMYREGNVESWIKFFLSAVVDTAKDAYNLSKEIVQLNEECLAIVFKSGKKNIPELVKVLEFSFSHPILTTKLIEAKLRIKNYSAIRILKDFSILGIFNETSQKISHNQVFRFTKLLKILNR